MKTDNGLEMEGKEVAETQSAQYETVIGLEVHVELATKTKIFCSCSTAFGAEPNTQCCPVCMGMPGTLPVLNKKVVEYAIATGLALNGSVASCCKFDRKNYFYPDLPKAYQISELYAPIIRNAKLEIETEQGNKTIRIHEIHMEEDAGKLVHDASEQDTFVDYNRCGVPLLEIVSEPDMRSAEEVLAYLERLKLILQYIGVSDCKMQEGSLRADINLSVRKCGETKLGTRTEMKNMNSFKAIARAIEAESKRQIALLEHREAVVQETRRWDDAKGESIAMRSKEEAQDYRYFPEPDLPPVWISKEWCEEIRASLPELPEKKKARYEQEYGLPAYDAAILTGSKHLADIFEAVVQECGKPKEASNWLMTEAMRLLKETGQEAEECTLSPKKLAVLIKMVAAGEINRSVAKEVFEHIFKEDVDPQSYVKEHGLGMVRDTEALEQAVRCVLEENTSIVEDYRNGKEKVFGFLVGQVMKKCKGKANPADVNILLNNSIKTMEKF